MKEGPKTVNESNKAGPSVLHIEKVHFRPGKKVNSFKPNDSGRPFDAISKPNTSNL